jgi:hypothetical protein
VKLKVLTHAGTKKIEPVDLKVGPSYDFGDEAQKQEALIAPFQVF